MKKRGELTSKSLPIPSPLGTCLRRLGGGGGAQGGGERVGPGRGRDLARTRTPDNSSMSGTNSNISTKREFVWRYHKLQLVRTHLNAIKCSVLGRVFSLAALGDLGCCAS